MISFVDVGISNMSDDFTSFSDDFTRKIDQNLC